MLKLVPWRGFLRLSLNLRSDHSMSSPIVVSENYVSSSFIAHVCFLEAKAWSVGLGSNRIRVKVLFLFSFSLFSVMFLCISGFSKHACDTSLSLLWCPGSAPSSGFTTFLCVQHRVLSVAFWVCDWKVASWSFWRFSFLNICFLKQLLRKNPFNHSVFWQELWLLWAWRSLVGGLAVIK